MALVLHGERFWYSPYVFTVFVGLREKGLAFTVKEIALDRGEQKSEAFRAASLTARVPALDHVGFVLAESSAIVEYLDDVFPGPKLFPTDAKDRARARQLLAWIRSDLMPLREQRATSTMFYARAETPLDAAGRAAAEKLLLVASDLVADGATSLFGSFSIADADLAFMLHRLILNGHDVPTKVRTFAEAVWTRASVREFVEHARPDFVPYGLLTVLGRVARARVRLAADRLRALLADRARVRVRGQVAPPLDRRVSRGVAGAAAPRDRREREHDRTEDGDAHEASVARPRGAVTQPAVKTASSCRRTP